MKKIGLVFAMTEELNETLKKMNMIIEHKVFDLTIYECESQKRKCYLIESGVGKVNSARATQVLIDKMEVDCIINVGVAGSVSKKVKKCDVVIANDLVQHDYDLTAFDYEKGTIPNVGRFIKCDENLINSAKKIKIENNVFFGTIASGDIFVSENKMGEKINSKFKALCVEMEGAAIAQVCYLCKIPFLVIRAISDSPYEEKNNITFGEFLEQSSKTVADSLMQLLEKV